MKRRTSKPKQDSLLHSTRRVVCLCGLWFVIFVIAASVLLKRRGVWETLELDDGSSDVVNTSPPLQPTINTQLWTCLRSGGQILSPFVCLPLLVWCFGFSFDSFFSSLFFPAFTCRLRVTGHWVSVWPCKQSWDDSMLSINVSQVAAVSLLVSASVCVSWYPSAVSVSVRPTQFDPDPVSLLFPTPLPLSVGVYCQGQTPRFAGMLVEFRLFFQVTVVCASRGVSVNSHTGRQINTLTLPHAYTEPVAWQPHTLYGEELTAT